MKKHPISLKMGLLATIVACWLVPILIIAGLAGLLLGDSYERSLLKQIDLSANNALSQVQTNFLDAIDASKAVSYDGVVRSAYREYCQTGDAPTMYRTINEYLNQSFARDDKYKAAFITFLDEEIGAMPYVLGSGTASSALSRKYRANTDEILTNMADADTAIRFLLIDDELYMARNLLDSYFDPYACVVVMLEPSEIFRPLDVVDHIIHIRLHLDELDFTLDDNNVPVLLDAAEPETCEICYTVAMDKHTFSFTGETNGFDLWGDNPWLARSVAAIALLVFPLMILVVYLFNRNITRPIETLAEGNRRVREGERGYQIMSRPANVEFANLFDNFNTMSAELRNQFDRLYLEQQAAQRAKIKALQSQINPHFLNNTLEIINWEARLAGDDRVSAMIEALSTMLDAALDRDGRTQIPLSEELGYVDAYLYIIRERLGESFRVEKDIDETLRGVMIPRLILQPIVENAVEHDITPRRGGKLAVRVRREEAMLVLEVEHDGTMTASDREKIRLLLSEHNPEGARVGLRNVSERLRLIYGEKASLTIDQTAPGTVLARLCFPAAF